jgi:uncharacterized DUF497 family protein
MSALHFEWDERKAAANVKKHGVSFEEARSVFYDERAKLIDDPDHSEDEDRFVLLGLSSALRLLVVCHCYRGDGGVIRFISARKATAKETKSTGEGVIMRKQYDFSNARKNPYAAQLKKQVTIRLDEESIGYFKSLSEEVGIPYQSLINLYLRDCAASHRKLNLNWK